MQRVFPAGWLLICALSTLAGCTGVSADYDKIDLASVSGTVTLDDQPLANATVVFEAEDKTFSFGTTDDGGDYTLQFNSELAGITPGEKVVRISSRPLPGDGGGGEEEDPDGAGEGAATKSTAETIPARYNKDSELKATVESGSNTFDFDLKSAP